MADPIAYKVTMNRLLVIGDMVFGPPEVEGVKKGFPRYTVSAELYNGTLADGSTPFADACATVEPVYSMDAA